MANESDSAEQHPFITQFDEELLASDRAAVILGASALDAFLRAVLIGTVDPPTKKSRNKLFGDGPNAVLGNFSSRTELAYAIGIIDERVHRTLTQIREIRNEFSHTFEQAKLDVAPHRDKLASIVHDFERIPFYSEVRAQIAPVGVSESAQDFCVVIKMLLGMLDQMLRRIVPATPPCRMGLTHSPRSGWALSITPVSEAYTQQFHRKPQP